MREDVDCALYELRQHRRRPCCKNSCRQLLGQQGRSSICDGVQQCYQKFANLPRVSWLPGSLLGRLEHTPGYAYGHALKDTLHGPRTPSIEMQFFSSCWKINLQILRSRTAMHYNNEQRQCGSHTSGENNPPLGTSELEAVVPVSSLMNHQKAQKLTVMKRIP